MMPAAAQGHSPSPTGLWIISSLPFFYLRQQPPKPLIYSRSSLPSQAVPLGSQVLLLASGACLLRLHSTPLRLDPCLTAGGCPCRWGRQVHLQLVEAGQHICELQLLLNQFAEVKTKGGHKRYIDYRNAMAC